MTSSMK